MNVVVTGAAGFVGGALTEALAATGAAVLAVDHLAGIGSRSRLVDRFEALGRIEGVETRGAPADDDDVLAAMRSADAVYHLATFPSARLADLPNHRAALGTDVVTAHRILDALASAAAPPVLVVASTAAVYPYRPEPVAPADGDAPTSALGAVARAVEHQCELASARGVPVRVLRLFGAVGPWQRPDQAVARLVDSVVADVPFPLSADRSSTRDHLAVADAARAFVAAGAADVGRYWVGNVGRGEATALGDVVAMVEAALGAPVLTTPLGDAPVSHRRAAIDATVAALGWEPTTPLGAAVEAQVDWQHRRHDELFVRRSVVVERRPAPV